MSIELITRLLDSSVLTNTQKQIMLSIYRLQFKTVGKKITGRGLAKYIHMAHDNICKQIVVMTKLGYLKRETSRSTIKINWEAVK